MASTNAYLRIFGKKFIKDMGFDVDKPKSGTKSKIPKKRMEQTEQYVDEIDVIIYFIYKAIRKGIE